LSLQNALEAYWFPPMLALGHHHHEASNHTNPQWDIVRNVVSGQRNMSPQNP
jgi:hypothetical protein